MPQPFALQTVLDLMQDRADAATQALARLLASEHDAQAKLALLEGYREEYLERFRQAARDGLEPTQWRNYQTFLDRLDEAIAQQRQAVRAQQTRTAAGQEHWQQQKTRLQAFTALAERHHDNETRNALRQEQKMQDEFAARAPDERRQS